MAQAKENELTVKEISAGFDCVMLVCRSLASTIEYPRGEVSKGDGKSRAVCVSSGKSVAE